jgi:hypothetical protein
VYVARARRCSCYVTHSFPRPDPARMYSSAVDTARPRESKTSFRTTPMARKRSHQPIYTPTRPAVATGERARHTAGNRAAAPPHGHALRLRRGHLPPLRLPRKPRSARRAGRPPRGDARPASSRAPSRQPPPGAAAAAAAAWPCLFPSTVQCTSVARWSGAWTGSWRAVRGARHWIGANVSAHPCGGPN